MIPNDAITVLIVDAHAHEPHALLALLAATPDIQVVGEAFAGRTAVSCRTTGRW